MALLAVALAGCSARPYARDPLLRDRQGVRGDHAAAARPLAAPVEPVGPAAPAGPLIGAAPATLVTSR